MPLKEVVPSNDDRCGAGIVKSDESDPFLRACQVHDWSYVDHSLNNTPVSRNSVDRAFARNVDRLVRAAEFNAGRVLPLRRLRAFIYKRLVFLGGRFFW